MGHEVLQEGEKVKILDPYDSSISDIGQIHSLSAIHAMAHGHEDANVNVINVTSNIPLLYEDKI